MEYLPRAYYKIPYIDITRFEFDDTIHLINKSFALKHNIIPMEKSKRILTFCMAEPNKELYEKLSKRFDQHISLFKSCKDKIKQQIEINYNKKFVQEEKCVDWRD